MAAMCPTQAQKLQSILSHGAALRLGPECMRAILDAAQPYLANACCSLGRVAIA